MLPKVNPISTKAWKNLADHFEKMHPIHLKQLFQENPTRFEDFNQQFGAILFDFSKNNITNETLALLTALANECGLPDAIKSLFNGDKINQTENRAVMHWALRNFSDQPAMLDGVDVMPDIKSVLHQMKTCCNAIHSGTWTGFTGKKIKYIVNIGIGGSDLGPVMVTEALKP